MVRRPRPLVLCLAAAAAVTTAGVTTAAVPAGAVPTGAGSAHRAAGAAADCPPAGRAVGYSDALDKLTLGDATLGGLSSLAWDARAGAWASAVDNHGTDPSRIWFFRGLAHPTVVGAPLVLRRPDGTPYDGTTADDEGLAVLPDGDYLLSSEVEPSIRIFGRDGVQRAQLPVPARFSVAPAGQATSNATLEGLTITPDGRHVVAAMEAALSGDVAADGTATYHRFLVYDRRADGSWRLAKQVGYRTETGYRIPEVAAYDNDSLVVEEAAYAPATGNAVRLFAVTGLRAAPNVSEVANLSDHPADVLTKRLVADVTACPSLGAPAKETQTNPLMDNYEGMAVIHTADAASSHDVGVALISDDNFSPTQTTRVLRLSVRLP